MKWYIDSGCSRHMTGRKENLRDYRSLENAGVVKFGNNHKCQVKGYGKVTNGNFTVNRVAYVEGLQHNLISISQLVVGTGNQVIFNEEGSIISNVKTNEILLKSKRYGDMFTLDIKPILVDFQKLWENQLCVYYQKHQTILVGFGIEDCHI